MFQVAKIKKKRKLEKERKFQERLKVLNVILRNRYRDV